jgi:acylphosphatase
MGKSGFKMISRRLNISGKVQGVYYRASAKQKAMMLGVRGFVRNEADGSVCMELEGEDEAVEAMTKWCRMGPALARVDEVKIEECDKSSYVDFAVIH